MFLKGHLVTVMHRRLGNKITEHKAIQISCQIKLQRRILIIYIVVSHTLLSYAHLTIL